MVYLILVERSQKIPLLQYSQDSHGDQEECDEQDHVKAEDHDRYDIKTRELIGQVV